MRNKHGIWVIIILASLSIIYNFSLKSKDNQYKITLQPESKYYLNELGFTDFIKNNKINWNQLGSGVKIAFIDTGINDKNENGLNRCFPEDSVVMRSYLQDSSDIVEEYPNTKERATSGHGGEIASAVTCPENTILKIKSSKVSLSGTAPGSKIISLNAFPTSGDLTPRDLNLLIKDAYSKGARVINISLGIPDTYKNQISELRVLEDTINKLYKKDILVIVSSGNSGPDYISPPSNFKNVLTIGSVTSGYSIKNKILIGKIEVLANGGELGWSKKDVAGEVYPVNGYLSDGCSQLNGDYSNKIAILLRGNCSFEVKMLNIKAVRAKGVILVEQKSPIVDNTLSHLSSSTYSIPMVMITDAQFKKISEEMFKRKSSKLKISKSNFYFVSKNRLNTFSTFSNIGDIKPEIVNYGGGIITQLFSSTCIDCASFSDGTSESAAITTGLVASLWSQHKDWSPGMIKNIIIETSENQKILNYLNDTRAPTRFIGGGLPNIAKADKALFYSETPFIKVGGREVVFKKVYKNELKYVVKYNNKVISCTSKAQIIICRNKFLTPGEVSISSGSGTVTKVLISNSF